MVEHGATPLLTPEEARELGSQIVIFPFAAIAPAYAAIRESMVRIKETGRTGLEEGFTPKKLLETGAEGGDGGGCGGERGDI